jgi:hypothetical protein
LRLGRRGQGTAREDDDDNDNEEDDDNDDRVSKTQAGTNSKVGGPFWSSNYSNYVIIIKIAEERGAIYKGGG